MNNNNPRHPAQRPSGPNAYLQICLLTKVPLTIHFTDGEIVKECLLVQMDTLNLLLKVVATGQEFVVHGQTLRRLKAPTKEHTTND